MQRAAALLLASACALPAAAQPTIPPASVVRFNILCATCHEGECSSRLSFKLDPGATDSHIRRYTGDLSLQAARELNALLEHMKLNCGYYAIDLPSPQDGRWSIARQDTRRQGGRVPGSGTTRGILPATAHRTAGAPAGAGHGAGAVSQRRTAARMPRSKSAGVGGQPGTRTSTGMTFSTAPQLA